MVRVALVIALAASAGRFAPVTAQDAKEAPKERKPVVSLKGGDPAPPLKVSKWLQGEAVKGFEPGKVYVVEFWATWCGPCIAVMPHLADLQEKYRGKGVTVIGFTSRDLLGKPEHGEKEVAEFIDRRGKKFGYTFAYADDGTTADAWMKAAGREGIPCTFVVDRAGRIAYIGHPMYLPAVLPRVVEGRATAKEVGAELARIEAEFRAFSGSKLFDDPKAGLRRLKAFEAKYPELADFMPAVRIKLSLLPKHGEPGEAKEYAGRLVARAAERGDQLTLTLAASILRLGDGKEDKELLAVAVKAAEAKVRLTDGADAQDLLDLASTWSVAGDVAKARSNARKAIEAATAEPAAAKESIEREARKLLDGEPGNNK